MENKVYIHKILVGDYVKHTTEGWFGYVISVTIHSNNKITYLIIDFDNRNVTELDGSVVSIACGDLVKVIVSCYYLEVIKRSITFNYPHLCNNYCNHLKTFPEACEKYCPFRKIAGSTYFPSFHHTLKFAGFFDTTVIDLHNPIYTLIFSYLSKALPKPDRRFRDLSVEGVLDILNNGDKYRLQDYIIYKTYIPSTNYYCNFEMDKFIVSDNFIPSILKSEEHPCDYCIYKDTIVCNNCKLKEI
jgi:hypothetical protein